MTHPVSSETSAASLGGFALSRQSNRTAPITITATT